MTIKLNKGNTLTILLLFSVLLFNCSDGGITEPETYDPLKINITTESLNEALNHRIPEMIQGSLIPGLQMAVIKNDEMIWNKGFGVKNNSTQEPIDDRSIFQAASLSKTVFAYAVMKLIEEGKLALDRPLIEYVTEAYIMNVFYKGNPLDDRFHQITARMVLTHSTGFPNWRSSDPINFINEPGERFSYSGEGFVYLQKIVEYITGKTMNQFVTESVFESLGMTNSSYVWKDEMEPYITNGHQQFGQVNPVARPGSGNAAGSLLTTAEDYAKFILAIVNSIGIREETVDNILTTQIQAPVAFDNYSAMSETISWGLGIGLQQTDLGKAFWHWGDNDDFKCFTITYPNEKIGLVYFTNSYNGLLIANKLIRLTLGGYYPVFKWMD